MTKEQALAEIMKRAADRRWFLDYELNPREMMKYINRQMGGKLTGQSKTTMSMYSKLSNGYTVRVSDHAAYAKRSQTNIQIEISQNRAEIYVNGRCVDVDYTQVYTDHTVLYNAVVGVVKDELEYLIDWAS